MIKIYPFLISISLTFFSCSDAIDKSLITDFEKLVSPKGKFVLYRYHVESSMAFGSGFTAIKILDSKGKCNYSDRDFFTFDKGYPFCIKWKNDDTLSVKCLFNGRELSDQQPIRKEIRNWKNWTFEVEYYSQYSAGNGGKFKFENYISTNDSIIFKSKKDTLAFSKNEIQFSIDTNHIYVNQFRVDTFHSKLGISLNKYDLIPSQNINLNYFFTQQSFERAKVE